MDHAVQLAVEHFDHSTRYYPANAGWRIDAASRCIVIGKGLPRTHIPLDNVVAWRVERVPDTVNLGDRLRLMHPAPNGCDDCSVVPGERHRYPDCPGNRRAAGRSPEEPA